MNQRLPLGKRSQEGKVLVAITTVLSQQNLYFKKIGGLYGSLADKSISGSCP